MGTGSDLMSCLLQPATHQPRRSQPQCKLWERTLGTPGLHCNPRKWTRRLLFQRGCVPAQDRQAHGSQPVDSGSQAHGFWAPLRSPSKVSNHLDNDLRGVSWKHGLLSLEGFFVTGLASTSPGSLSSQKHAISSPGPPPQVHPPRHFNLAELQSLPFLHLMPPLECYEVGLLCWLASLSHAVFTYFPHRSPAR